MFVIANSLTVNKKAVSADWQYNMRVTECRLATVALALACGIPPARPLLHILVVNRLQDSQCLTQRRLQACRAMARLEPGNIFDTVLAWELTGPEEASVCD